MQVSAYEDDYEKQYNSDYGRSDYGQTYSQENSYGDAGSYGGDQGVLGVLTELGVYHDDSYGHDSYGGDPYSKKPTKFHKDVCIEGPLTGFFVIHPKFCDIVLPQGPEGPEGPQGLPGTPGTPRNTPGRQEHQEHPRNTTRNTREHQEHQEHQDTRS